MSEIQKVNWEFFSNFPVFFFSDGSPKRISFFQGEVLHSLVQNLSPSEHDQEKFYLKTKAYRPPSSYLGYCDCSKGSFINSEKLLPVQISISSEYSGSEDTNRIPTQEPSTKFMSC